MKNELSARYQIDCMEDDYDYDINKKNTRRCSMCLLFGYSMLQSRLS